MKVILVGRGFEWLEHDPYIEDEKHEPADLAVVRQSSAIGEYPDAYDRPGSSFLWVGANHCLSREQVTELATRLLRWVGTGSLRLESELD